MACWIVIPTYNEAKTIRPLLERLFLLEDISVLVVDDSSPDGTGQLVESMISRWPRLAVLHRPAKQGLASAYHQGLQEAINRGATEIIHCDADGSHDPALIPQMRAELHNADLVIASRYVPGGGLKIPLYRQWISRWGNIYMRLLLGHDIHDWSTGYKAWRTEVLGKVLAETWQTVGYACLIEMNWLAKRHGARIREVPMVFIDRQEGESKFSLAIMLEDLRVAWKLRWG